MAKDSSKAPAAKGKRLIKLASMSANVASKYAGNRVKSVFQNAEKRAESVQKMYGNIGDDLADTLGELKGAAMKVGQIASQAKDIFPDEIANALTKLQKEAPPMDFEVIEQQIIKNLGDKPYTLFERFEQKPFAAASIGQVHKAITKDGQEVVVKVQYPGVKDAVDSDLAHLKFALRASRVLKVKKEVADAYFAEIRERLMEELDYINEAANLRKFHEHHQDDEKVIIPSVLDDFTSEEVLTMTFEDGDHLSDIKDNPAYTQDTINEIGHRIFNTMAKQIFDIKAVHGDPHPGNFAFRPDGTLIMYDFGCVKTLDANIVSLYRDIVQAGLEGDMAQLDALLIAIGGRIADGPKVEDEYYEMWRDIFLRPFLSDEAYDFGTCTMKEDVMKAAPTVMKRLGSFQPVVETVFIDRAVSGQYMTMCELGVQAAFYGELCDYLALPQATVP